jgi:hypothetical protein
METKRDLKIFTLGDALLILFLISGIALTFPVLKSLQPGTVVIYLDNRIIAEYPIDQDRTFSLHGKDGKMVIQIKDHAVSVQQSACIHQICVRAGKISHSYNQIICTPNHILITLKESRDSEFDAFTR